MYNNKRVRAPMDTPRPGGWRRQPFTSEITVPFSWVSPLSGIERNEKG